VGAVLAAMVVPRGGGRWAAVAVGVGVPAGPLLVLRLDRLREFGVAPALLTVGVLAAWGAVGATLAAAWWARPTRRVQRTDLPVFDLYPGGERDPGGGPTPAPDPRPARGGGDDPA
jgi:hypothetical protein